jgi:hypothetical protein
MHILKSIRGCGFLYQVVIMLPYDESGRNGPSKPLPDQIEIKKPKEEVPVPTPQA